MYICTKFQKRKKLRYLTVMVISNRPLRFIIATLVACLPLMSFANPEVDSVKVHTEVAHETTEQSQGAHAEPTDVKSKIKAFIGHHVLDSHDFTFLSDEVEGEHYGFSLPIIVG
jgi:F-type H+-transporting ATPase subunit a